MLEFTNGDIFDVPADIRVNTVNCVGVMGAGVALAFKNRYPEMFKDYQRDCKSGQVRPGKMHVWKSLTGDWVINFPTKRDWRESSRYEDIETGLDDLRSYLDEVGPVKVALPALGCGNGGLDWNRVSSMIREKLDGVNAHIFVFEPAASHRASKKVAIATGDDFRSAAQLGYELLDRDSLSYLEVPGSMYVIGRPEVLSRKWIALLPSQKPAEREIQALEAIAKELGQSKANVTIALVYGTKISEEISDIFTRHQIDTVLLLPFGVLTRKTLAKNISSGKCDRLTIASSASANEKWSRQLFAQTMEHLRFNSDAVLLSDPEPDWLISKGLDRWGQTSISYVRYESTPHSMRTSLEDVGARSISRRADTGAPNIEHLLAAFGGPKKVMAGTDNPDTSSFVDTSTENAIKDDKKPHDEDAGEVFDVILLNQSNEERRALLAGIFTLNLRKLTVSLPIDASEADRRFLLDLGFSRT